MKSARGLVMMGAVNCTLRRARDLVNYFPYLYDRCAAISPDTLTVTFTFANNLALMSFPAG
jgi:hypothetical protein